MYREYINNVPIWLSIIFIAAALMFITYCSALVSKYVFPLPADMGTHRKWADGLLWPLTWGLFFLLAFTISNTWTYLNTTNEIILKEAVNLKSTIIETSVLKFEGSAEINVLTRKYVDAIMSVGWEALRNGYGSLKEKKAFNDLLKKVVLLQNNPVQSSSLQIINANMQQLLLLRQQKLNRIESLMPDLFMDTLLFLSCIVCAALGFSRCEINVVGIWTVFFLCMILSVYLTLAVNFGSSGIPVVCPNLIHAKPSVAIQSK